MHTMSASASNSIVLVCMLVLSPCSLSARINYGKSAIKETSSAIKETSNRTGADAFGNPGDHPYTGATLGKKLGGGSFGKVFEIAFPEEPGWVGAMKHIDMQVGARRGIRRDDIAREFFMQHHVGKHVGLAADVLSWGVGSNRDAYAIVEYISGGTLDEYVKQVWGGNGEGMGKQADALAKTLYTQIVYAVMSMHRAAVVHMDFKPANLMINNYNCAAKYDPKEPRKVYRFDDFMDPQIDALKATLNRERQPQNLMQRAVGKEYAKLLAHWQNTMKPFVATPEDWEREKCAVKLIDFGLSCIADRNHVGCANTGAGQGTPAFMTKEQFEARQKGHKANQNMDIWAMGLTLYFMLFGTFPHLDAQGRLNQEAIVKEQHDQFHATPWHWMLFRHVNGDWKQAAQVLKNTLCPVKDRKTAKQLWDEMEYLQEYKRDAVNADQRERQSSRRHLPEAAGGVVDAEGNRKATTGDAIWNFFKIDWGNLFAKLGS